MMSLYVVLSCLPLNIVYDVRLHCSEANFSFVFLLFGEFVQKLSTKASKWRCNGRVYVLYWPERFLLVKKLNKNQVCLKTDCKPQVHTRQSFKSFVIHSCNLKRNSSLNIIKFCHIYSPLCHCKHLWYSLSRYSLSLNPLTRVCQDSIFWFEDIQQLAKNKPYTRTIAILASIPTDNNVQFMISARFLYVYFRFKYSRALTLGGIWFAVNAF